MIEINGVSKKFNDIVALSEVSFQISEDGIFGLIGTNGSGKSTLLRIMSGVIEADTGELTIDGEGVYGNEMTKEKFFFIADEPYVFANATPKDMELFYSNVYKEFDSEKFYKYLEWLELSPKRKINTFSKGMKKQLALAIGVSANTKYLLCDETFDGLDPVMRKGAKAIFASEMESRGLVPIIASHNLRELEDICDHIALLHRGGVLLSKDMGEVKDNIQKVQCVFENVDDMDVIRDKFDVIKCESQGKMVTITLRGSREEISEEFNKLNMVFYEILPLSLEEIFIRETEVVGYDVQKLIFG